jgi:hypothetical protein
MALTAYDADVYVACQYTARTWEDAPTRGSRMRSWRPIDDFLTAYREIPAY